MKNFLVEKKEIIEIDLQNAEIIDYKSLIKRVNIVSDEFNESTQLIKKMHKIIVEKLKRYNKKIERRKNER